ncbi:hypothetical protein DYU11_09550 [Fibrisoma montanum]|uniref:Uncharacterized protein n=1 Tax=Fibrisoma montanum TaxID=2305895 RepID=A0A418MFH4_9BACT|nr:hypothetical protein [Fibrisoma montanum]RIV25531.1 hypothetical protein DYU11_09550 [Fibrisoma montanum]
MQRAQLKEFYGYALIIAVLTIAQLYSVYVASTTDLVLTWKHYAGFAATGISAILLLYRQSSYLFFVLGLTLVLGYENMVGFTPELVYTSTRYYFNNMALPVSYQDFSMYLLLIWAYVAHNRLRTMAQALFVRS